MEHCCKNMESHLQSGELEFKFNPKFREYGIVITDGGQSIQTIVYCPWCGSKLPSSLRDKWFEIVCDKLGFEPGDKNIPEKYHSEEWWQSDESGKK